MENNIVELSCYAFKVNDMSYQYFCDAEFFSWNNPNDYVCLINYLNRSIDLIILKKGEIIMEKQLKHNYDGDALCEFLTLEIGDTFGPEEGDCWLKIKLFANPNESYESNM